MLSKIETNINTNNFINNFQLNDINKNIENKYDSNDFELTKFIKKVDNIKGSLKFFLHLKNDYFLSYEDEKAIILYNNNFDVLKRIPTLEENLCYIKEKESGETQ